jgi:hypothetical protein
MLLESSYHSINNLDFRPMVTVNTIANTYKQDVLWT